MHTAHSQCPSQNTAFIQVLVTEQESQVNGNPPASPLSLKDLSQKLSENKAFVFSPPDHHQSLTNSPTLPLSLSLSLLPPSSLLACCSHLTSLLSCSLPHQKYATFSSSCVSLTSRSPVSVKGCQIPPPPTFCVTSNSCYKVFLVAMTNANTHMHLAASCFTPPHNASEPS